MSSKRPMTFSLSSRSYFSKNSSGVIVVFADIRDAKSSARILTLIESLIEYVNAGRMLETACVYSSFVASSSIYEKSIGA